MNESQTLYYTVCLPKIWNQNVSIPQILIMFLLNFISFYFQSTLLVLLPNIILLILYVLINNITVYKGYVPVSESSFDFAHYVSKLNTKVIKDQCDSSIYFPYESDYLSLLKGEINNSSFLQNKSSVERVSFKPIPIKNNSVPTTPSTIVATSCNNSIAFQSSVPATTTCTFSSGSPVCSVYEFSSHSLSPPVTTPVSLNDSLLQSSFSLSKSASLKNFKNSNDPETAMVSKTSPLNSTNLNIHREVSQNNLSSNANVISEEKIPNESCVSSNFLNQELDLCSSKIVSSDESISVENNEVINQMANYKNKVNSNLSLLEMKSMLESLPKFRGDSKNYKVFREKFKILTNHQNINSDDKAYLLYSSLADEVLAMLGKVTSNGSIDLQLLWDNLDSEFSLPQNSQFYYSNALFSLGSWPICNNLESLTELYKFILSNYLGLEREGVQESDSIYGMKILSLLDGELAYNVASVLSDNCKTRILPDILQLLKQEIRYLQIDKLAQATKDGIHEKFEKCSFYLENNHPEKFENPEVSAYSRDFSKHKQNCVKDACVFCKSKNHSSIQCDFYSRPFDYYSNLFDQFRCFNCFEKGHKGFNCPQNKLCTFCQDPRPHSPLLCNKNNKFH